jgi:hypothetical protein
VCLPASTSAAAHAANGPLTRKMRQKKIFEIMKWVAEYLIKLLRGATKTLIQLALLASGVSGISASNDSIWLDEALAFGCKMGYF